MVPRQRVVLVFVRRDDGGRVLLAPRPRAAPVYAGRLSTVGGEVAPGETVEAAARRALDAELGGAAELVRGGLAVDFTDTVRRRAICFRVHPFLARVPGELAEVIDGARWLDPDDVIVATALGETLPELDE